MPAVNGLLRLLWPGTAIVAAALGAYAVLDRLAVGEQAAERRALLARQAELTGRALAPGSPLGCLNGGAGDTLENACEQALFADASSAAAALTYTAARLALLKDAAALAQRKDADVTGAFAGLRRSIELDRFGLAAQVLADRDGCTPEHCPAFALLSDTGALKANLKARVFDQYVSRHAADWGRTVPAAEAAPQARTAPSERAIAPAASAAAPAPAGHPVNSRWDFPSAASIPPVSIMNAEPARPKDDGKEAAEAQASQSKSELKSGGDAVPVPPKRPQAQAPSSAEPR